MFFKKELPKTGLRKLKAGPAVKDLVARPFKPSAPSITLQTILDHFYRINLNQFSKAVSPLTNFELVILQHMPRNCL
jgi:hypothetical protein